MFYYYCNYNDFTIFTNNVIFLFIYLIKTKAKKKNNLKNLFIKQRKHSDIL